MGLLGSRRLFAPQGLEKMRQVLFRQIVGRVPDLQKGSTVLAARAAADRAALRGIAHRIRQEIRQDPREQSGVGMDPNRVGPIEVVSYLFSLGVLPLSAPAFLQNRY